MTGTGIAVGDLAVVVAQSGEATTYTNLRPAIRAAITFVATLLVGAIVLNALPNRTARAADLAVAGPLRTLVFGLACLFVSVGAALLLLVVPLVNLFAVLLAGLFVSVTSAFGATVVGRFLLGGSPGRCLVVGAAVAAGLAVVPVGGGVAQLLVNGVGAGALFREVRTQRERSGDGEGSPGTNPL